MAVGRPDMIMETNITYGEMIDIMESLNTIGFVSIV